MIWTKLLILAIAIYVCHAGSTPEEYFVYVLENGKSLDVYATDLLLEKEPKVFPLPKRESDVANIFLSRHKSGLIVYWSYKNSSVVGRYQFSKNKTETKEMGENNNVFLGVGDDEKMYLYSPSSKNILVYDYNSESKPEELGGLQNSSTDMHCADVDPTHKDEIFFAECSDGKFTGRVYEVSEKALQKDYEQTLPKCFDKWRITPNGEMAVAVSGKEIYVSSYEGAPFLEYHKANDTIVGFAAGNNDLFYSTKENKIFKISKDYGGEISEKSIPVKGSVKAMAVYIPPKRYLAYVTEKNGTTYFNKTDFDFLQPVVIFKIQQPGLTVDKMYFGHNITEEQLYWTNEHNLTVYSYLAQKQIFVYVTADEEIFVGIGYNETTYFWVPSNKTLVVFNQFLGIYSNQNGLKNSATNMSCVDVDPRNRQQIFFAECTENNFTGKVYDVKEQKVLENYNQPLPVCFQTWKITPNGRKAYAVYKNQIYLSPKEGAPFEEYALIDEDIQDFAVGNNELFYTIKKYPNKIFKITPGQSVAGYFTTEFDVPEKVNALAVYEE